MAGSSEYFHVLHVVERIAWCEIYFNMFVGPWSIYTMFILIEARRASAFLDGAYFQRKQLLW